MIPEYEIEFGAYLCERIKYDRLEIPKGYEIIYNIPSKDLKEFEE